MPLGLLDIRSRIESGYYRQIQAFDHDCDTLAGNVALVAVAGGGAELAAAARAVATFLKAGARRGVDVGELQVRCG